MMPTDATMPQADDLPGDSAPEMAGGNEVCIPVGSLKEGDTEPAVGDSVDFSATGKVSRVEGENAYVTLDSVNGAPVAAPAAAPAEMSDTDLQGMAAAADNEPNY